MSEEEDSLDSLTIEQLKEEEKLISSHKVCNIHTEHLDIDKFRDDLVKIKLDEQFYDANVLATLFCLFDSVTYIPADNGQAYAEVTEYLTSLFTSLRRIGAESVNGNALLVSIKNTDGVIIAKSPKMKLNDELFHEYFVGVMALNKLRRKTPNFAYILGAFKCLPPVINENKKVTKWCDASGMNNPNNLVNYVLYENVRNGQAVEDLIQKCSAVDFYSWFVQICISLHFARHVQFTHYDLHTGNVMVRPWGSEEELAIPYEVQPDLKWYVKASTVVQIIDYGMSHVFVNGKHFGKRRVEHAGVHPDKYRPMFDLYKFVGFGLLQMIDSGNSNAAKVIPLWSLLNRELLDREVSTDIDSLREEMIPELDTWFAISTEPLAIESKYTVWTLIQAMRKDKLVGQMWKQIVFDESPNLEILTCGNSCPIPLEIEQEFTGEAFEDVQESMNMVKFGARQDKSVAMSALPSQVMKLRTYMSSYQSDLLGEMERCNGLSYNSVSNSVDTPQFQSFVSTVVEPFLSVKTKLQHFEAMKQTLCDYYSLKGGKCETNEFEFTDQHQRWMLNLSLMRSKLDRLIVTSKSTHMREQVLGMF